MWLTTCLPPYKLFGFPFKFIRFELEFALAFLLALTDDTAVVHLYFEIGYYPYVGGYS